MKKVLLYNIMDDEEVVIKEWLKTHPDVAVDSNKVTLNPDTVDLAKRGMMAFLPSRII